MAAAADEVYSTETLRGLTVLDYTVTPCKLPPLKTIAKALPGWSVDTLVLGLGAIADQTGVVLLASVLPSTRITTLRFPFAPVTQLLSILSRPWEICARAIIAVLPYTRITRLACLLERLPSEQIAKWARAEYLLGIEHLELYYEDLHWLRIVATEGWLPSLQTVMLHHTPLTPTPYVIRDNAGRHAPAELLRAAGAVLSQARTPDEVGAAFLPLALIMWDVRRLWTWMTGHGKSQQIAYAMLLAQSPAPLSDWTLWVEHLRLRAIGLEWIPRIHRSLPSALRLVLRAIWSTARVRAARTCGSGVGRLSWGLLARLSRFVLSAEFAPGYNSRLKADAADEPNAFGHGQFGGLGDHTPLTDAVKYQDDAKVVAALAHPGVDVNAYNAAGHTALHVLRDRSFYKEHPLRRLLDHPFIDPNKPMASGHSTLEIFVRMRDPELVRMLLQHPRMRTVGVTCRTGETVLALAERLNEPAIADLLRAMPGCSSAMPVCASQIGGSCTTA